MFCRHCGKEVEENVIICPNCGCKVQEETLQVQETTVKNEKSQMVAGLLAIFLGTFGAHKFYLGRKVAGIIYILFCWTLMPGLVGFIEGIIYLCCTKKEFNERYVE